jgi:hypothetical protein
VLKRSNRWATASGLGFQARLEGTSDRLLVEAFQKVEHRAVLFGQ